jgi:hypothetical protein
VAHARATSTLLPLTARYAVWATGSLGGPEVVLVTVTVAFSLDGTYSGIDVLTNDTGVVW